MSARGQVSARSRILATAEYEAQQKSVLEDVVQRIAILTGERASIDHEINDLSILEQSIRAGLIIIEGQTSSEFQQQQVLPKAAPEPSASS